MLAEQCLTALPQRLAHVRGVADAVGRGSAVLGAEDARTVMAAAWLHDVGYAPAVRWTGFHPVDGAWFVRDAGFSVVVVSLVAYHTGAVIEAEERGLSQQLAEFPAPPVELLDVLTFADMTTSPDGDGIGATRRIAEILTRYPDGDPVHRAVTRSAPELLAAVRRVEDRLAVSGSVQPR